MIVDTFLLDEEPYMYDCGMDVVIENDIEDDKESDDDLLSGSGDMDDRSLDQVIDDDNT